MSLILCAACGEKDNTEPDNSETPPPDDDGEDMKQDATVDTGTSKPDAPAVEKDAGSDAASHPASSWKPGQKIPANEFWASGTDGLSRDWHNMFGAYRGRPTTSTWIDVHWIEWDWLIEPGLLTSLEGGDDRQLVWEEWKDFKGPIAMSMSMAGSDNVDYEVYDQKMLACAKGDFDQYWATFAKNAKAAGRNGDNTIVSLAQEFNGTWFPWNPLRTSMDTWMSCWKHVYTAIHSESDLKVVWVFSATAHTEIEGDYAVKSVWDAYPGDEYVDVLGLTRYDFKTLGDETTTDWRDTCENEQDICYAAKMAREHNKKLAVVEWSIERGEFGYGDNPNFVQMMFGFFADNRDILMLENNFNNYGEGDWNLFPLQANNAKSSAKYKELYTP